jgi:hypothetical protein
VGRALLRNIPTGPLPHVSRNSSVGIATGCGLDDRGVGVRVPVGSRVFSMSSRPALGSTQPPVQWVPGLFPRGLSGRGVKLTTHLQLVPRSRKCGFINSLPRTPSWRSAELSTGTALLYFKPYAWCVLQTREHIGRRIPAPRHLAIELICVDRYATDRLHRSVSKQQHIACGLCLGRRRVCRPDVGCA